MAWIWICSRNKSPIITFQIVIGNKINYIHVIHTNMLPYVIIIRRCEVLNCEFEFEFGIISKLAIIFRTTKLDPVQG